MGQAEADANRGKTNYSYDGLNRVTQAAFNVPDCNGPVLQSTVSYTWDGGNRLTQAVDSLAGTIVRTYDGLDDLTAEQTPQGEVSYSYDAARRRTSMQVMGQTAVNYTWDNANRLTGITQGTTSVGFSYDAANRCTQLTLPNGVTVAYSYDTDSRVIGLTYSAGSTNLGNLVYSYDADGRRTSMGGSLASVSLPANVSGNTFNAANEMTAFNGAALSYDANGNLLSDGTNTYTRDAHGHLTQINRKHTTVASFVYDAFGRRMNKTISRSTTQFLYDGLKSASPQVHA